MDERSPSSSSATADLAMARYADGDDSAFAELYDCLADRLYGYLLRKSGDQGRAEDLLQQTFMRIHHERGHFIPGAAVAPWAFRIAGNLAIDGWRKDQRRQRVLPNLVSSGAQPDQSDDLLEASEAASMLDVRLRALPASQRTAFELVRLDGLTLRETAQMCGTTVAAVKQLLHRAQTTLRSALEPKKTT